MSIGGNIEQKQIGFQIGVNGTHDKTEINSEGHLTLAVVDTDANNNPIYTEEGSWISEVIDLQDKFTDFDKVFATEVSLGSSTYAILTRVSDNGMDWSEWTPVAMDGSIQSDTKQYIQIKINLFAGYVTDIFLISDFDIVDDVSLFDNTNFIETSNGLRLKRDYEYDMTLDTNWTEEGSLHRKKIARDDWLRVDKMNVLTDSNFTPVTKWFDITMTSNTSPSPLVASSSSNHTNTAAWKLFDGKTASSADRWYTASGNRSGWVSLFLGEAQIFNVVLLNTKTLVQESHPKSYDILASNDGVNYETLGKNMTTLMKEVSFDNDKKYLYYRIHIHEPIGSSEKQVGLTELKFGTKMLLSNKTLILHEQKYKKFNQETLPSDAVYSKGIVPTLTSNSSNGLAFSSPPFVNEWGAYRAFSESYAYWSASANSNSGYIGYLALSPMTFGSYSLMPNDVDKMISKWRLYGSNNTVTGVDGDWEEIDYREYTDWESEKSVMFNLSKEVTYLAVKLIWESNVGNTTSGIYINKFNFHKVEKEAIKASQANWSTISSALPTKDQFLSDGMDSLSPLLDRRVEALEPQPMTDKSEILNGAVGKVFSKTLDLKKYLDIRSIKVEVKK